LVGTKQPGEQDKVSCLHSEADSLAKEHPAGVLGQPASQLIAHQPLSWNLNVLSIGRILSRASSLFFVTGTRFSEEKSI
jgi:hypothetical protein